MSLIVREPVMPDRWRPFMCIVRYVCSGHGHSLPMFGSDIACRVGRKAGC